MFRFFRRALILLGFVAFFGAGYLAVSIPTSCRANAQICSCITGTTCIQLLSFNQAIIQSGVETGVYIGEAAAFIVMNFELGFMPFVQSVENAIEQVTRQIAGDYDRSGRDSGWWDTFWWYNLRPAMQSMAEQLSVRDADQSLTLGTFTDAMDTNRTLLTLQRQEIQSHREQRPGENVCVAGTLTGGMTRAASFRRAYNAAAPAERAPRSGNARNTTAAKGTGADMKARWDAYVQNYCNPVANAGAAGCATAGAYMDRDLDITGEIFARDTIDLTETTGANKMIIDDLITNVAEPFVRDTVKPSALGSPEGREVFLAGESYRTKRQAILDALYHIVSRRAPGSAGPNGSTFVSEVRQAAGVPVSLLSNNASHNEIMQVMLSERFQTGTYSTEQIDEPENNARELVIQQAFQAMQLSDTLDLLDRYAMVLAARVGAEVGEAKPFDERMKDMPK